MQSQWRGVFHATVTDDGAAMPLIGIAGTALLKRLAQAKVTAVVV